MLEVAALSHFYGKHQALADVALGIKQGEIVAILGANGAGKSTLLKSIAGLVRPAPGAMIAFEGQSIAELPAHLIVERGIALVPEGRGVFGDLTVAENLQLGAYPARARAGEADRLARILQLFPRLAERMTQAVRTMSGGEQQMVAIGRALMTNPRLLVLDEATEGLAPLVRAEIWSVLAKLKAEGQAILLIDKNLSAVLRLADRHAVIEKGRTVWSGTSAALEASPEVRDTYLHL